MQSSCRSRLRIQCAADVKTSDAKQAASNGKSEKEPEYYEVRLASHHALKESTINRALEHQCSQQTIMLRAGVTSKTHRHQIYTRWRRGRLCCEK